MTETIDLQQLASPLSPKSGAKTLDQIWPIGLAVCLATSRPSGLDINSPIPCNLTPDCIGTYWVRRLDIPDHVQCTCTYCNSEEILINWRGTWWDFHKELLRSQLAREQSAVPVSNTLLSVPQYLQLCQVWSLPRQLLLSLYRAKRVRKQYQLRLAPGELAELDVFMKNEASGKSLPSSTLKLLNRINARTLSVQKPNQRSRQTD